MQDNICISNFPFPAFPLSRIKLLESLAHKVKIKQKLYILYRDEIVICCNGSHVRTCDVKFREEAAGCIRHAAAITKLTATIAVFS